MEEFLTTRPGIFLWTLPLWLLGYRNYKKANALRGKTRWWWLRL